MGPKRKRRWLRRLAALLVVWVYVAVVTRIERDRLAPPLPGGGPPGSALDQPAILDDLRSLSSPVFEGRRTGTPGGLKARAYVTERFRAAGLDSLNGSFLQPFSFVHRSIRALWHRDRPFQMTFSDAANVIGYLPGASNGGPCLVLSAHYDHLGVRDGSVYPGADDNASGVAALLGVARYLKLHPPNHCIVFAAFDAEELGLRGSRRFVERPAIPLDRVAFNLNLDMISRSEDSSLVAAGTLQQPALHPYLVEVAARTPVKLRLGHDRPWYRAGLVPDWTESSDHAPFHDRGIPYLYLGVENHPDYHRPTDTFERVDQGFYLQVAELILDLTQVLDANLDQIAGKGK
ncbi:MAG: M28 family peptidase [Gemmatimonadales bacterium]